MALITCNNCGKKVSDKAKACPHCGNPIDFEHKHSDSIQPIFNQNQETQAQPENTILSETVEYYKEPERKSNAGLIVAIVLGFLALLGIGGWLWYDNQQKLAEKEKQLALLAEQARQDSIAKAEILEKARQDSIEKAMQEQLIEKSRLSYINILKGYLKKYGIDDSGWGGYFLFDITRDGLPELWIKAGTCEADFMLYIYTLKDGVATKIYEDGSSHSGYYRGKDYVLQWWAYMGWAEMARITYDGEKIKTISIYSEENIESSDEYRHPSEPEIQLNRFDDFSPIYEMIK